MDFQIDPLDRTIEDKIRQKIENKTKPPGALGLLECIALQIATIQQTLSPSIKSPHLLIFAGDHGITASGVSQYPKEVTYQMVLNFLNGGAAINIFCEQHNIRLKIIDAGVAAHFSKHEALIDQKVALGTHNFLNDPAMSIDHCQQALALGAQMVEKVLRTHCNVIGFGEMGIGNTSSASLLMHKLTGIPLRKCVGKGTGLSKLMLERKTKILLKASENFKNRTSPLDILAAFGGFEIAQMCGAMLHAASKKMVLLIDGFIATSALLIASKIAPHILDYCIFCHQSDEKGHKLLLNYLDAKPILQLGMRLGEGTGCAVAYPLIESSVKFFNEMASFENANISKSS